MKSLLTLKPGERYTVVRFGETGSVFSVQLTLKKVQAESYGQCPESIVLVFSETHGGSPRGIRFFPHTDFLIFQGWIDVDGTTYRQSPHAGAPTPLLEKITRCPTADTTKVQGERA